ncbi:riboflavin synthase [Zavarzinella formosa]|uniref:riboflavin synthase n=1 Tax=Zavarzinella formosa TaxID=360055 RepID=UPI00030ACB6E|nr:riboflavin synthase [Zavarzinella formosa]
MTDDPVDLVIGHWSLVILKCATKLTQRMIVFTGLVETLATVERIEATPGGKKLVIRHGMAGDLVLGESVAVNGACLTVVAFSADTFDFDVGPETLLKTNLGHLKPGDSVNLERSLRVGDRLGGHFVQGHVDAVGTIDRRERNGDWEDVWFRCPASLTKLMVPKGSIAVDGVSLTLVNVEAERFSVMLIPHTQAITTLGLKVADDPVNLEADMLAKHVAKLIEPK